MSILETFYVLFKADTSDVKKGSEEVQKSTKQLEDTLTNTSAATEKIGGEFADMARSFTGLVAGAISFGTIIAGIKSANDYAFNLGNTSRLLGVQVEDLDAWGNAVQRSGGTAEGFQASLKALGQQLGGSPAIAMKILPQLADSFQRLGRYGALRYGRMLGLDDNTILFLEQGRRAVEDMIKQQKELGVVTTKETEIAKAYNQSLLSVKTSFRMIFLELASAVIPYVTRFLDILLPGLEFLGHHMEIVKGALLGIAAIAAVFLAPMIAAFVAANAPLLAIITGLTALITVFSLVYEDIEYFLEGNKSLIGTLLEKWPLVGAVIKAAFEGIRASVDALISPLKLAYEMFEKIAGFFGGGNKKLTLDIQNGQSAISSSGARTLGASTSTSMFASSAYNRNNAINTGPITINTQATDANGIAASLGKGINDHIRYANSYFDDGSIA